MSSSEALKYARKAVGLFVKEQAAQRYMKNAFESSTDFKNQYFQMRNRNGGTLLHHCSRKGWSNAVRWLLTELKTRLEEFDYKEALDEVDKNRSTALHLAIQAGCFEVCRILIWEGCDVNCEDKDELTPLLLAVKSKKMRDEAKNNYLSIDPHMDCIIPLLLRAGAIWFAMDGDGNNAVEICEKMEFDGGHFYEFISVIVFFCLCKITPDRDTALTVMIIIRRHIQKNSRYGAKIFPIDEIFYANFNNFQFDDDDERLRWEENDIYIPFRWRYLKDETGVRWFIKDRSSRIINFNTTYEFERTALMYATYYGNISGVRELIKAHCLVDSQAKDGSTALLAACLQGHLDIVKELLSHGANPDQGTTKRKISPILLAAVLGREDIVVTLIEGGASPMSADVKGITALHVAARKGYMAIVKHLLPRLQKSDINAKELDMGNTPLMLAAKNGFATIVKELLTAGADIDVKVSGGSTALHSAAFNGHITVVEALLDHHADINPLDDFGYTPLIFASDYGHDNVVEVLLKKGANPNVISRSKKSSALSKAAAHGHNRVLELLIKHGANFNDDAAKRALELAEKEGRTEIVRILKRAKETGRLTQDDKIIPYSHLSSMTIIGEGSFGKVYKAQWQGVDVAVKMLDPAETSWASSSTTEFDDRRMQKMLEEASLLASLRHPNVVSFYGICNDSDIYMVMEYCARDSLTKVLEKVSWNPDAAEELTWSRRITIALDAAKGMVYLHSRNVPVIHRDLYSSNLLCDEHYRTKVADFGLSKVVWEAASISNLDPGTMASSSLNNPNPRYNAPEVLKNGSSATSTKSDVYSFAIVLWQLASWIKKPFPNIMYDQTVKPMVENGMRPELPESLPGPDELPQSAKAKYIALMEKCWAQKPNDRPEFTQVVEELKEIERML